MGNFDALDGHNYLNIKTFRKNGDGVPTPVWFYKDGDRLYITTGKASGKVKRITHNAQVEVAPCEADGALLGNFETAQAEILLNEDMVTHAYKVLKSKYGHEDTWTHMVENSDPSNRAYIKVASSA